jgi:hypothetical protein
MGGVYYLFLRGMRPETGARRGVWFTRPESGAHRRALDRDIFPWARGLPEFEPKKPLEQVTEIIESLLAQLTPRVKGATLARARPARR